MRACPILRRAALLSLLVAGGGCVRQDPPRLAAAAPVIEPEITTALNPAPGVPLTHAHWRLRYTRL